MTLPPIILILALLIGLQATECNLESELVKYLGGEINEEDATVKEAERIVSAVFENGLPSVGIQALKVA